MNKPHISPPLVKGWELVNVTVEPAKARAARDAEPHVASVSATLVRVARDGTDAFSDNKPQTAHFDEPAVVDAARALVAALAKAAAGKLNGPVFVQDGPNATTDYVSVK